MAYHLDAHSGSRWLDGLGKNMCVTQARLPVEQWKPVCHKYNTWSVRMRQFMQFTAGGHEKWECVHVYALDVTHIRESALSLCWACGEDVGRLEQLKSVFDKTCNSPQIDDAVIFVVLLRHHCMEPPRPDGRNRGVIRYCWGGC